MKKAARRAPSTPVLDEALWILQGLREVLSAPAHLDQLDQSERENIGPRALGAGKVAVVYDMVDRGEKPPFTMVIDLIVAYCHDATIFRDQSAGIAALVDASHWLAVALAAVDQQNGFRRIAKLRRRRPSKWGQNVHQAAREFYSERYAAYQRDAVYWTWRDFAPQCIEHVKQQTGKLLEEEQLRRYVLPASRYPRPD